MDENAKKGCAGCLIILTVLFAIYVCLMITGFIMKKYGLVN